MFTSHDEEERRRANPWIERRENLAFGLLGALMAGALFAFAYAVAGTFGKGSP